MAEGTGFLKTVNFGGFDKKDVLAYVDELNTKIYTLQAELDEKKALLEESGSGNGVNDEKYEELIPRLDPEMDAFDKLMYLNGELFTMIENTVPIDLLASLYSTQLITKGERHLLDSSRVYYKILRQIISEGQQRGQIRSDITANEISKLYAVAERGLMYDWCICGGNYSLKNYAASVMPLLLASIREK